MGKITAENVRDYIGQEFNENELNDVLDTYMILTDIELVFEGKGAGSFRGILDEISKEEVYIKKPNSVILYNDSFDLMEGISSELNPIADYK